MSTRLRKQKQSTTQALDSSPHQRRLLYMFTYLAAMTALAILHLALDDLKLSLKLVGATSAGFTFAYFVQPRYRALTTYVVSALAIGVSIVYYLKIQSDLIRYGNYLGILLGVLTALLAYKAFSPRDHRFILMICVIYLLFSSVASYDLKFMLLLPLFLIFAGVALYITNQIEVSMRVASTTGKAMPVSFGVGVDFIWMLLRGIVGVIVLSVVIFIFTPHTTQENQKLVLNAAPQVDDTRGVLPPGETTSNAFDDDEVEIGIGSDFDLTDTRHLTADPRPVLQMKSHRAGHLRAQVYDVYTGSSWVKSQEMQANLRSLTGTGMTKSVPLVDFPNEAHASLLAEKQQIEIDSENIYSNESNNDLKFDINRQEIKLLEEQPPFYFSLYQPFRLENISVTKSKIILDIPMVDDASTIRPNQMAFPHPAKFTYTVYSLEPRIKTSQLEHVYSKPPAGILDRYIQLPLQSEYIASIHGQIGIAPEEYRPISQQLVNYAGQFALAPIGEDGVEKPLSVYAKVLAIQDYLLGDDEGFVYDRQFKPTEGSQEITEAFCLGTREGYCRQFASSMAVLCRLNGVPARVVSGYSPGTYSFIDNAYIYKASNAHSWVEVYFDGYGWVMFDPTPAGTGAAAGGEAGQWLAGVIDFLQNLFIIDPAGTQQLILALLRDAWQLMLANPGISLGVLAVVLLLTAGWWFARRFQLHSHRQPLQPENSVVEAYLEASKQLARLEITRQPGQTGRMFLSSAAIQLLPLADSLDDLGDAYQGAAFSTGTLSDDTLRSAWESIYQLRGFVRDELIRRKQLK